MRLGGAVDAAATNDDDSARCAESVGVADGPADADGAAQRDVAEVDTREGPVCTLLDGDAAGEAAVDDAVAVGVFAHPDGMGTSRQAPDDKAAVGVVANNRGTSAHADRRSHRSTSNRGAAADRSGRQRVGSVEHKAASHGDRQAAGTKRAREGVCGHGRVITEGARSIKGGA